MPEVVLAEATASIGAEGGEIILKNGAKLTVPAGVLPDTRTVTVSCIKSPRQLPGSKSRAVSITGIGDLTGHASLVFPGVPGFSADEYDAVLLKFVDNTTQGADAIELTDGESADFSRVLIG